MKPTFYLLALLIAPLPLSAATVALPTTPVIAQSSGSLPPSNVGLVSIGISNSPVTVSGSVPNNSAFTATASGTAKVDLLPVLPLGSAGGVTLSSRTQIDNTGIYFSTSTAITGAIGSIVGSTGILDSVVSAGVIPKWGATIDLMSLGAPLTPNTNYSLDFRVIANSGLLSLSPTLANNFTASISDSNGVIPASVLGLTDLVSGSADVTLNFKTGMTLNGPVLVNFGGQALLSSSILGDNSNGLLRGPKTVYSISGISVNAVVPEPSGWVITVLLSGLALTNRNRRLLLS
jgi:hypothetical protein